MTVAGSTVAGWLAAADLHLRQRAAAAIPVLDGFAWSTVAGTERVRSGVKPALGFRLPTGSLGCLLEKPRSDPGPVSLLRACWFSILSMPSAPRSSRAG